MGKAWDLIQDWADAHAIPGETIKDAQLARLIGFSQSNFPTWRNPKSMPPRETVGAIANAIKVDFTAVRDAFLEDLRYDEAPTAAELEAAKSARKGRSEGKRARKAQDDAAERGQEDGPEHGA